jgi:uridine phosphorylase
MKRIAESELVLHNDGSVYHLRVHANEIADKIILVGDPGRTELVASFFDEVTVRRENREIFTRTGTYKGKKITVLSTGMGTDNLDIVVNELDALANIDLKTRTINKKLKSLTLVRIGTSGGIQPEIPVGSLLFSSHGIGLDGLLHFYAGSSNVRNLTLEGELENQIGWPSRWPSPYVVEADSDLLAKLSKGHPTGMTMTASGFYGPQGRELRLPLHYPDFNDRTTLFHYNKLKVTNFEMETSALYGLSKMLGHKACTGCVIIANRANKTFIKDYKPKMNELVKLVLDRI